MPMPEPENEFQKFKRRSASMLFRWLGFWFAVLGLLVFAFYIWLNFGTLGIIFQPDKEAIQAAWDFSSIKELGLPRKERVLLVFNVILVVTRFILSFVGQFFGVLSFVKSEDGNSKGLTSLLVNDILFLLLLAEYLIASGVWEI